MRTPIAVRQVREVVLLDLLGARQPRVADAAKPPPLLLLLPARLLSLSSCLDLPWLLSSRSLLLLLLLLLLVLVLLLILLLVLRVNPFARPYGFPRDDTPV